ncbi:hypothetical protein F4820DRAFT_250418 [Hypoxylon rubiginosum]|uniref:Uncharacterized protein n=1 Tax=Hypoxylon rubiginosum TaxID=110542 RepID=A0ACB9Z575_9PEZI|nr:hypothetical protein F4820DRAFT_250418 [Hypoxylon rubiginosum]
MKPCGCMRYFAVYPCGHELTTWEYCGVAKAKNLLKRGPPTACASYTDWQVSPDLEDTCGSTCLTKPFQCRHCGADKQVSWRCSRCNILRDPETFIWDLCRCRGHMCTGVGVGKPGAALCKRCAAGSCSVRSGDHYPSNAAMAERAMAVLNWKCHNCSRLNRTPADAMVCGGAGGCQHKRCGICSALFGCNCKCGCDNCFLEGGTMICDTCIINC